MEDREKKEEEILQLMREGDFKKIQTFIDKGFDVDYIFISNLTPLYLAITYKDIPMIQFLLEKGANPNFLPNGNNAFYFLGINEEKDEEIAKILVENGTLFLPFWPMKHTIIESLEDEEYATENKLNELYELNAAYSNNNNNSNNSRYHYSGGAYDNNNANKDTLYYMEKIQTIRNLITLLRPLKEKYVRKLQINFMGQNRVEKLEIDERADVATLKSYISNFFLDGLYQAGFSLIMPSFRMKNKTKMDEERRLSNYGIRNETRIVVTLALSSQRHGGTRSTKNSKKKTKKTRKN